MCLSSDPVISGRCKLQETCHCTGIKMWTPPRQCSSVSDRGISARWLYSTRPRTLVRNTLSRPCSLVTLQSTKTCLQTSAVFRNSIGDGISNHQQYRTDRKHTVPSISTIWELLRCAKNKILHKTSVYAAELPEVTPVTTNTAKEDKKRSSEVPVDVPEEKSPQDDDVVVPAWFLGTRPVPETGWERLKDLFVVKEGKKIYYEKYSKEVSDWINVMGSGFIIGFVYGGVPAARHARLRYIDVSHMQVYHGRREAVGEAHKAAHRGLIRYGYRWGWRVAVFAGIFHGVSTCLAVYRDKDDALNYSAAGALAGGLYKISLGLRGIIGGAFLGILMGVPTGLLTQLGQTLQGETYVERRRRLREEILELRKEEWKARLQLMEDFILEASSDQALGTEPSTSGESATSEHVVGTEPSNSGEAKLESAASAQSLGTEPRNSDQAKLESATSEQSSGIEPNTSGETKLESATSEHVLGTEPSISSQANLRSATLEEQSKTEHSSSGQAK